jgi:hypothetical protein
MAQLHKLFGQTRDCNTDLDVGGFLLVVPKATDLLFCVGGSFFRRLTIIDLLPDFGHVSGAG